MKLHYKGKFNDEKDLEKLGTLHPGSTMFREPEYNKFTLIISIASIFLFFVLALCTYWISNAQLTEVSIPLILGSIISILTLIPHEFLHAICFKKDVYLFQDLSKGVLFVYGPELMSKKRFIFMSLLPNIIFGFIPYLIFILQPHLLFFGILGALCIPGGVGDYINVFNAATQVPKDAKIYMYGTHSYWIA